MFLKTKSKPDHGDKAVVPKKSQNSSLPSATEQDWASPTKTRAMKVTKDGKLVVSVLVEVVGCDNLCCYELTKHRRADAYCKIKLSKPNKKVNMVDLHKTKSVKDTNNPRFSIQSQSTFLIDGLPLEDLYESDGLHVKVKHHKHELGSCDISPHKLLEANGLPITIPLIHPLKLVPERAGTLTIIVRPTEEDYDMYYYKSKGLGYFADYKKATKEEQERLLRAAQADDTVTTAETAPEKSQKDKSGWTSINWTFASNSKKKSDGAARNAPTILLSPSHDEDLPTVASSDQGSPCNTDVVVTINKVVELPGADLGPEQIEAAMKVETDQSTTATEEDNIAAITEVAAAPTTPDGVLEESEYEYEPDNTTDKEPDNSLLELKDSAESLDVHTPKESSRGLCGGGQCCFILFGW